MGRKILRAAKAAAAKPAGPRGPVQLKRKPREDWFGLEPKAVITIALVLVGLAFLVYTTVVRGERRQQRLEHQRVLKQECQGTCAGKYPTDEETQRCVSRCLADKEQEEQSEAAPDAK